MNCVHEIEEGGGVGVPYQYLNKIMWVLEGGSGTRIFDILYRLYFGFPENKPLRENKITQMHKVLYWGVYIYSKDFLNGTQIRGLKLKL